MSGLNVAKCVNFSQNANLAKSDLTSNELNSTQNGINLADCFAKLAKILVAPKAKRTANAR